MLPIDLRGHVASPKIKLAIEKSIERGDMKEVRGIIVHQTGGATAQSAINSYRRPSAKGEHFLIDKNGSIYQTASLYKQTWHVGKLKTRCLLEKRCSAVELRSLQKFNPTQEDKREMLKKVPERFPSNLDSVGIELVGEAFPRGMSVPEDKKIYETITSAQAESLKWLINELTLTFRVPMAEIFRHPDVSRKNPTEAGSARW